MSRFVAYTLGAPSLTLFEMNQLSFFLSIFFYQNFVSVFNSFYAFGLFYTPLKYQETFAFLMFLGGIERDQWREVV